MLYRYLKVIDLLIQYLHIDIVTSAITYPYWFSFGIWSISMPFCYLSILIDTFDTLTAILTSLRWLRSFSLTFGPVILWMTPQADRAETWSQLSTATSAPIIATQHILRIVISPFLPSKARKVYVALALHTAWVFLTLDRKFAGAPWISW